MVTFVIPFPLSTQCTSPAEQTTDEEGGADADTAAVTIAIADEEDAQKDIDYRQRLRKELVSRDGHGWV